MKNKSMIISGLGAWGAFYYKGEAQGDTLEMMELLYILIVVVITWLSI